MKIDLQDTEVGGFNYEFLRAISYQNSGGAELGECVAAAARIHEGDFDSWIQEWTRLAASLWFEHCVLFVRINPRIVISLCNHHHIL
jgi:hypothetical protein